MVNGPPIAIAQLADVRLFADPGAKHLGVQTARTFQAVLERIRQLEPQPHLLQLAGNLSQDETPESYRNLYKLLSPLGIPTYWLAGDRDSLQLMTQTLNGPPFSSNKSLQLGRWHLILLSTNVPGQQEGWLSATSLDWLDKQLELAGDRSVAIVLHHPPFRVGSDWLDRTRLQNPDDFFTVIDRLGEQVRLVFCGHVCQNAEYKREDTRYFTIPSTGVQFEPGTSECVPDTAPPAFRLSRLYPNGGWDTKVEWVKN